MNREFDLKRALAGEPVETMDGKKVTELKQFSNGEIAGLIYER